MVVPIDATPLWPAAGPLALAVESAAEGGTELTVADVAVTADAETDNAADEDADDATAADDDDDDDEEEDVWNRLAQVLFGCGGAPPGGICGGGTMMGGGMFNG